MAESLLDRLVREINGWSDEEIRCRVVNDGGGHFDLMGIEVTKGGRERLRLVLRRIIEGDDVSDR